MRNTRVHPLAHLPVYLKLSASFKRFAGSIRGLDDCKVCSKTAKTRTVSAIIEDALVLHSAGVFINLLSNRGRHAGDTVVIKLFSSI